MPFAAVVGENVQVSSVWLRGCPQLAIPA